MSLAMELVFGENGEPFIWPDGEPVTMADIEKAGNRKSGHEGFWIKRVVWKGERVDLIDFGVNLDMF